MSTPPLLIIYLPVNNKEARGLVHPMQGGQSTDLVVLLFYFKAFATKITEKRVLSIDQTVYPAFGLIHCFDLHIACVSTNAKAVAISLLFIGSGS